MSQLSDDLKRLKQAEEVRQQERDLAKAQEEQRKKEEIHRRLALVRKLMPMVETLLKELGDHTWGKSLGIFPRYSVTWYGLDGYQGKYQWRLQGHKSGSYYGLYINFEAPCFAVEHERYLNTKEHADPLSEDALRELLLQAAKRGPYSEPASSIDNY